MVQRGKMLYEGKAKRIYETDSPDLVIIEYKDDATAFDGKKKGSIEAKGVINNEITNILFTAMEKIGIPTHFCEKLDDRQQLCRKVEIVPLEVIVRNIGAGSFSKRYGVEEGIELNSPIIELGYKNDSLGDPFINEDAVLALDFAKKGELEQIYAITKKINSFLTQFFDNVGVRLVDFKIEFGRYNGDIILADEISPDTCRLWDKTTGEKLDKDRFRRDLGGVKEAYETILGRMSV